VILVTTQCEGDSHVINLFQACSSHNWCVCMTLQSESLDTTPECADDVSDLTSSFLKVDLN
jgi:hypothetical protein